MKRPAYASPSTLHPLPIAPMLSVLLDVIVPIFLLIGAGYLVGKRLDLDRRALARRLAGLKPPVSSM